jgi:hypothetical protein
MARGPTVLMARGATALMNPGATASMVSRCVAITARITGHFVGALNLLPACAAAAA